MQNQRTIRNLALLSDVCLHHGGNHGETWYFNWRSLNPTAETVSPIAGINNFCVWKPRSQAHNNCHTRGGG